MKNFDAAIHDCEEALKRDPANQQYKDGLENARRLAAQAAKDAPTVTGTSLGGTAQMNQQG
jgi:hypothetical protein